MVNFGAIGSKLLAKLPSVGKAVPQPAPKALKAVPTPTPLAKVSNEAVQEVAKKPTLVKKVALGAGVLGGMALISSATGVSAALGGGCEKLMGTGNCQFITAPEAAISRLTGLPGQLAEGIVFFAAGAFVVGTTYLAHSLARNGWLTAGTFTASTFVAVGVVNRED